MTKGSNSTIHNVKENLNNQEKYLLENLKNNDKNIFMNLLKNNYSNNKIENSGLGKFHTF